MPIQSQSPDLIYAFDTIRNKRPHLDLLFAYYEGPQPLKYSTNRLAETFDNITAHFEINWCTVVVDSTLDRVQLTGFDTVDDATDIVIDQVFNELHLDLEAAKVHEDSMVCGQGYLIVWSDDENPGKVLAYCNDPRICHVFYDPANPKKKTYAAKWFTKLDNSQEITLYYKDRLEHWTTDKQTSEVSLDKPTQFQLTSVETNPYGVIPVFELRSPGEIYKIVSLQDAENKLFADMMVAAEYGAFAQRYVISNADPANLKNSPNEIWFIPGGDGMGQQSSVGQFSPTLLENYLSPMDKIASAISTITRTPKHYFINTGANISGEALLAMEGPLTKKVHKRQREFGAQWQSIAKFILQLSNKVVDESSLLVLWDQAASVQPKTEAETLQIGVNTGIPLVTLLRRAGWTEEQLEQLEQDQELQQKAQQTLATAVLNDMRVNQNQMSPPDPEE